MAYYICVILMYPIIISLGAAQFTTEDLGCHGGRCYTLLPTCTQFRYSGVKCASLPQGGGHLASIPDTDTSIYLVSKLSTYGVEPIIGGIDVREPWRWTTGQRYYGRSIIEYLFKNGLGLHVWIQASDYITATFYQEPAKCSITSSLS